MQENKGTYGKNRTCQKNHGTTTAVEPAAAGVGMAMDHREVESNEQGL
jgi:hypothetical protein